MRKKREIGVHSLVNPDKKSVSRYNVEKLMLR
jgi:hypothetical protein